MADYILGVARKARSPAALLATLVAQDTMAHTPCGQWRVTRSGAPRAWPHAHAAGCGARAASAFCQGLWGRLPQQKESAAVAARAAARAAEKAAVEQAAKERAYTMLPDSVSCVRV